MKIFKLVSSLTIFLACMTSCQKKPSTSFTADKSEYVNGETMILTNTSENAYSYKWSISNLQTEYTTKDAQVVTNGAGEYSITLTTYSKNGKKSDQVTKTINVKKATGQVLLYTLNNSSLPIGVKIDNVQIGTITQSYTSAPVCGANGCVTTVLDEGEHTFLVAANGLTLAFSLTITPNICNKLPL